MRRVPGCCLSPQPRGRSLIGRMCVRTRSVGAVWWCQNDAVGCTPQVRNVGGPGAGSLDRLRQNLLPAPSLGPGPDPGT